MSDVLDLQQVVKDLKRLRQSKFKSSREFARKTGFNRETARLIEKGKHPPDLAEFIDWIRFCGADPAEWLVQYLSEDRRRIAAADKELTAMFRQALKLPRRRFQIEEILKGWAARDELDDRNQQ